MFLFLIQCCKRIVFWFYQVRVITVVLRDEKVDYRCLICCEDQLHVSKGVNNILSSHYNFEYGPAHIMCPLPSGCDAPSHITLLSAGGNFTEGKVLKVLNVSLSAMLSVQKVTDVLVRRFEDKLKCVSTS